MNVAQDGGERYTGEYNGKTWHGYTDGLTVWKSFRIPYNANTTPSYEDRPMKFDLFAHAEGIGMTGWDWQNELSRWVAFDFDAITGHSEKHNNKLTPDELHQVTEAAKQIPWVTVRHSTSGKGLHLYVYLEPVSTRNHNEHAALARSILGLMSAETGFDFASRVDVCGSNMWIWHRKMRGTNGLKIIKQGTTLDNIPANWRDHLVVVKGTKKRTVPAFVEDELKFDELTGQRAKVALDETHRALIKYLQDNSAMFWWDQDHHMLIAHTYDLKQAHTALKMIGVFETNATGKDQGADHNCFLFPMRKGAWTVRRYGQGIAEHQSWNQDGAGWTRCYLNKDPDLWCAARTNKGVEDPKGGFVFRDGVEAQNAAVALGINLNLDPAYQRRQTKMKQHKDGRLIVEIKHETNDEPGRLSDWLLEKDKWVKIFTLPRKPEEETDVGNFDDVIRHLVSNDAVDLGWTIKSESIWRNEPLAHVRVALKTLGAKSNEVDLILGTSVFKPWRIVNYPFQPEYPGDRKWNRYGAQFKVIPNFDEDDTSTWDLIFEHLGASLDEPCRDDPWCKDHGVTTGADYLRLWVASLFQHPTEPLPYLFLYGPQDSGKSIFHESLDLLIDRGVIRSDNALANKSTFNAELENKVLAIVEETDLRVNQQAYERIKDWVTARLIPIHEKHKTPYQVINTTHWVQCANSRDYCPIFKGDTRIVVIHVESLDKIIPKKEMIQRLTKEASNFLGKILKVEIPVSNSRLNIPIIDTDAKMVASEHNMNQVELFIHQNCHEAPGYTVSMSEFYDKFIEWIDPSERYQWASKQKVTKHMPDKFPKGRYGSNSAWFWGNISFQKPEETRMKMISKDGKLYFAG